MKQFGVTIAIALTLTWLVWSPRIGLAFSFDQQSYHALADADAGATIPPGTEITQTDWQRYKAFMPIWLQALYSRQYHWTLGNTRDYLISVGPTTHFPLPTKYASDGEKYGGQTQLVPFATGGLLMKHYVAGLPFPNPTEPNLGAKVMYNLWASFQPLITHFWSYDWEVDRFHNVYDLVTSQGWYQLSHLSDSNLPPTMPYAAGTYRANRYAVELPEQSRYTTELVLQPDDPSRLPETYVFLPSLRRSLRLSNAARCAPILGSTFVEDDVSWTPTNFNAVFLGKKRLLVPVPDTRKSSDSDRYQTPDRSSFIDGTGTLPGFMKAGRGHWELRTQYLVDFRWLANLGSYCFSHRINYVDAETWRQDGVDEYDNEGKFWKATVNANEPRQYRGQETIILGSANGTVMLDFQNMHASATVNTLATYDNDVPGDWRDAEVNVTPGSLARVMK